MTFQRVLKANTLITLHVCLEALKIMHRKGKSPKSLQVKTCETVMRTFA